MRTSNSVPKTAQNVKFVGLRMKAVADSVRDSASLPKSIRRECDVLPAMPSTGDRKGQ
jgi:hypothetical protein